MLRAMKKNKVGKGTEKDRGWEHIGWSWKTPLRRLHLNTDIKVVRE